MVLAPLPTLQVFSLNSGVFSYLFRRVFMECFIKRIGGLSYERLGIRGSLRELPVLDGYLQQTRQLRKRRTLLYYILYCYHTQVSRAHE